MGEEACGLILLCDEDIGTGVPKALHAVGYDARALVDMGWAGMPDVQWLVRAGRMECLVLSCNKKMLRVDSEKVTIIRERLGIVYLTNGEEVPAKVLKVLLTKWDALELLHSTEERPFVRFLSPNGRLAIRYRDFRL